MDMKSQYAKLSPELAEALARMDRAYQEAVEGLPSLEKDWEFVLLGLRSDVVIQVEEALKAEGLTRADLARRMGLSRAHISQILNEAGNFQLETIAKLAVALDRDIALRLIRKSEKVVVEPARMPVESVDWLKALQEPTELSLSYVVSPPEPAPNPDETLSAEIIEMPKAA